MLQRVSFATKAIPDLLVKDEAAKAKAIFEALKFDLNNSAAYFGL